MEAYLLVWRYSDRSSFGVLRAYEDYERATADMKLLNRADTGKQWAVLSPSEDLSSCDYAEYGDIEWGVS